MFESLKVKLIAGGIALLVAGGGLVGWGYYHFQPTKAKTEEKKEVKEDKEPITLKQTFPEPQVGQSYKAIIDVPMLTYSAEPGFENDKPSLTGSKDGKCMGFNGECLDYSGVTVEKVANGKVYCKNQISHNPTRIELSIDAFNMIFQNNSPMVDNAVADDNMYRATMDQGAEKALNNSGGAWEVDLFAYQIKKGDVFKYVGTEFIKYDASDNTSFDRVFIQDSEHNLIILTRDQFRYMFTANSNSDDNTDPDTQFAY